MEKIELAPGRVPYPMPCSLVGANVAGKPNYLTIAWFTMANPSPPFVLAVLNKAHYTNPGVKENGTFSINKILNFTEYVDNADDWPNQISNHPGKTDIAFAPTIIAGSILSWEPFKRFEISLYSKYVGKQYIDNTSSDERKLNAYFINDLLIRYNINIKSLKEFGISLKINNLTNRMYESNAWVYRYYSEGSYGVYDGYFPQAGINFLLGIDLKF